MEKRFPMMCGILVPNGFSVEAVSSAINYKPKPGDIFVSSYPKCGTTWMQEIVLLILRKGKPSNDALDSLFECPFFELTGTEAVDITPKPLAIKTHLPYYLAPISKDAKYIYICRNPMDCAVSYYHHFKNKIDFTFNEFFELFLTGDVAYGDYIDHLIGWYEHKDDPNIHFITYEDLKKNPREEILKVAKFIGEEYSDLLLKESKVLDDIVLYSSFDYMKKAQNEIMAKWWEGELDTGGRVLPAGIKNLLHFYKERNKSNVSKGNFLRKGVVGDWENHFSSEQRRRYEAKIKEKTASCDVMNLWK